MKDAINSLAGGNKIAFLLVSIILLSITYPFSEMGTTAALLFVGFYLILTGSSIYLVSSDRRLLIGAVLLAVAIAVTGGITVVSDFTAPLWIQLAWNASVLMQLLLIITLLVTFIIQSETVSLEVLFAAVAIYFIVGAFFAAIYTTIESIVPGSFVSSSGSEITWQRLTYFSLVTISTLGYGDIVPVASITQSLSALEASIGTLYIAILIGRFVSLYQYEDSRN
ncbi:MAG: ion channel [Chloroflexota bacterium]